MIDLPYYINRHIKEQKDKDLISKIYGKHKFKSLYSAFRYFEDIKNNASFINDEQQKKRVVEVGIAFSLSLQDEIVNPNEFLSENVFPNLDIHNVLNDLRPKESNDSTLVDSPCCGNASGSYVVKIGGTQTGTIKCNSLNKCGKTTSILKHVEAREGLNYIDTVKYLSDCVGIDYDEYVRNSEMHIEDKGEFRNKDFSKEAMKVKGMASSVSSQKDEFGLYPIEFKKADLTKDFKHNVKVSKIRHKYNDLSESVQLQIIYSYIKDFTLKQKNREDMEEYFLNRGIHKAQLENVGYLKANKINSLVSELKEIFGDSELVRHGILSKYDKSWKYKLETKDKEYIYNDSAVFFMSSIYSDVPTNIEFKFFGEKVQGSKRKAISMANNSVVNSNYYGNANNIDFIKNKNINSFWWTEGAVDCKTLENLNIYSNGLIGVGKHFNENLGHFIDKISIIAFDEDKAGINNSLILAKKLKKLGVEHIFIASWDEVHGNDLNDLFNSKNLDKVKLSYVSFMKNKDNEYVPTYDITNIQKINPEQILKAYKKIDEEKKSLLNTDIENDDIDFSITDIEETNTYAYSPSM